MAKATATSLHASCACACRLQSSQTTSEATLAWTGTNHHAMPYLPPVLGTPPLVPRCSILLHIPNCACATSGAHSTVLEDGGTCHGLQSGCSPDYAVLSTMTGQSQAASATSYSPAVSASFAVLYWSSCWHPQVSRCTSPSGCARPTHDRGFAIPPCHCRWARQIGNSFYTQSSG